MKYRFSGFELDTQLLCVTFEGKLVTDDPKIVRLLLILIEHYPATVTKELLLKELWPRQNVSEWSVSRLIADTRQILNLFKQEQEIIKTQHRVGYRLNILAEKISAFPNDTATEENQSSPESISQKDTSRHRKKWKILSKQSIVLASVIGMIISIVFVYWRYHQKSPTTDNPIVVAVLPVDVKSQLSEDNWIKYGIMDMVLRQLDMHDDIFSHSVSNILKVVKPPSPDENNSASSFNSICSQLGCTHLIKIVFDDSNGKEYFSYELITREEYYHSREFTYNDLMVATEMMTNDLIVRILPQQFEPHASMVSIPISPASRDYAIGINDFYNGDLQSAKAYFSLALEKDPRHLLAKLQAIYIDALQGKLTNAEEQITQMLTSSELEPKQSILAARALAIIQAYQGKFEESLKTNKINIEKLEAMGNSLQLAIEQVNYGTTLSRAGKLKQATTTLQSSVEKLREFNLKLLETPALINLSANLINLEQYNECINVSERAKVLAVESNSERFLAKANYNKSQCLLELGKLRGMESQLDNQEELFRNLGDNQGVHYVDLARIQLLSKQSRTIEAEHLIVEKIADLDNSENPILKNFALSIGANIYLQTGKIDLAEKLVNRIDFDKTDIRAQNILLPARIAFRKNEYLLAVSLSNEVKRNLGDNWGNNHQAYLDLFLENANRENIRKPK